MPEDRYHRERVGVSQKTTPWLSGGLHARDSKMIFLGGQSTYENVRNMRLTIYSHHWAAVAFALSAIAIFVRVTIHAQRYRHFRQHNKSKHTQV